MRRPLTSALIAVLFAALAPASAQIVGGVQAPRIDWAQRLGAQVPVDTPLVDSEGRQVRLADCLRDRPAVLALVYYECPMLCNLVLDGLVRSLRALKEDVGDDFDVLVVSIDPKDTPELARAKREGYTKRYDRPGSDEGWRFLVGREDDVRRIADAVGFEYMLIPENGQYAHPAGITILTPGGVVSRILYGTEFAPRDVKFSLMEAGAGTIGSPIDKVILRCFHYDPAKGKYGFAIMSAIRVLGGLTVGLMALSITGMIVRERRKRRREAAEIAEEAH